MKKHTIYRFLPCLLAFAAMFVAVQADAKAKEPHDPYEGGIAVDIKPCTLDDGQVMLRAMIDFTVLDLDNKQMVTLVPVMRSLDGRYRIAFDPIVISGSRRARLERRSDYFGDEVTVDPASVNFVTMSRKQKENQVEVEYALPFQKWMRYSRMVVTEQTSACANLYMLYADGQDRKIYAGDPYSFPAPYAPTYAVNYMAPPKEEVKIQDETYSAQLKFQSGRSNLLKDFGNNAAVLAEVDNIVARIKSDSLLTIRAIKVHGYASPEGTASGNLRLSQERAQAFVGYLHWKNDFRAADRMITAVGEGEDWNGLRKSILESGLADKDKVIDAIDNISNADRRKVAIKALSGGRTYKTMLEEYYPPLRRNEYTISYEVRGFNAQEAAALLGTRPQLLSLSEMFMAAELYDRSSKEFKNVFDIAARMYPNSQVAQFNVAAMEIENGSYDTAIARLNGIDTPEAQNNLGVAMWHKGEYEKSLEQLRKAADTGLDIAVKNLAEYQKWYDDRDE